MKQNDHFISSVVRRQQQRNRFQNLLESAATGVLLAEVVVIPLVLMQWFGTLSLESLWGFVGLAILVGLLVGGIVGLFLPNDPRRSAERIDRHYGLKDRILTAIHLLSRSNPAPMERLQLADAVVHARQIDPKAVQPYQMPHNFYRALGMSFFVLTLCAISPLINPLQTTEAAIPNETVVAISEQLEEELIKPLEELVQDNPEEKPLEELQEKMRELMNQLEQVNADPKESLATLAQMEQSLNQAMESFNLEAMDASLAEVGDALSSAEATRSAGQAMKNGEHGKAAQELEKLDADELSKQERNAVSNALKKATDGMNRRNQSKLAKLAEKIADEMQEGNGKECKDSLCELAGVCKSQELRKGICQSLGCKLALLSQCKSNCAGACANPKNGGKGTDKSKNPSKAWGTGEAGDPRTGEATQLDSTRQMQQVSGMQGAGPSEFETLQSREGGEETVRRSYDEAYKEFKKAAETALESEPIPLGQRQVIRKYFEAIRPTEGDSSKTE